LISISEIIHRGILFGTVELIFSALAVLIGHVG